MSLAALLALPAWIAATVLLQRVAVWAWRAVSLSATPLSDERTDVLVYHRALLTPRDASLRVQRLLLIGAGGLVWASTVWSLAGLRWAAIALFVAALAVEVSTWACAAANPHALSWRRGWRAPTRRLMASQITEVRVEEERGRPPLALLRSRCRLCAVDREGDLHRLPWTSAMTSLGAVEAVANLMREQLALEAQTMPQVRSRSAGKRVESPAAGPPRVGAADDQAALEQALQALRKRSSARIKSGEPT